MEILLLHPGGLGDSILSLPAIAVLREKFPHAKFTIAGNIDHLRPFVGASFESAVSLSSLPLHNLYSKKPIPEADVHFWNSFDRIVSWTGSGDPVFSASLKNIHPNATVASWRPGPCETRHVSQLFLDSLGPEIAGGRTAAPVLIHPGSEASQHALKWLNDRGWNGTDEITVLHPGAGSKSKRWPLSRFASLALWLARRQKKLLIIGGPAEPGLANQILEGLPESEVFVAESLPLDLLAAIIRQCRLFVGNDSGIAHLAAALGMRSLVLFGPTLPRHWAPLGPVKVLRNPSGLLEDITINEVIQSIE